jgi:hypothetical protein
MWVGQGVGLFKHQPAAEVLSQLVADSHKIINRLGRHTGVAIGSTRGISTKWPQEAFSKWGA